MGAVRAVVGSSPPGALFASQHFNDEIVVKMELQGGGNWILMGRVTIYNVDGDSQIATAKLVHNANVVIREESNVIGSDEQLGIYVQAGLIAKDIETITLECNSYNGRIRNGSIIALKVDEIEFQ
jgi:hypothetical protein